MSLTVALIARDEAERIERCLDSVRWADEVVVVVDDRTVDATADLARRHSDRVFVHRFESYPAQRQWAQSQASSDWILWMDCDEVIPPALAAEVQETLRQPSCNAYRVPRRDFMFGRWIRHGGWYPQYHLKLHRRDGASWQRDVHEQLVIGGPIGTLKAPTLHYSHRRVSDWIRKMADYTSLEARAMHDAGTRVGVARILFEPPMYAGYKYFIQQGWRDGLHGLALALLLGNYRLLRNLQVWDLQQSTSHRKEPDDCPPPTSRS